MSEHPYGCKCTGCRIGANRQTKPDAMRILESLTPGGSEYVGDPERCAEYVRECRLNQARTIVRLIKQRNSLRQAATQGDPDTMSLFAETSGDSSVGIPGDLCEFRFSKCLVEDDEDLREWMRKEFAEFAVGVMDSGPNIWFSDECPVCGKRLVNGNCGNQSCPAYPREDGE